jgi:beta-glucosidase/6-phospho-beta-glucosidase/beta-galactosidase
MRHFLELKEDWFVMNSTGSSHKLKYNRTHSFPQITEGWEALKVFEGFPENVEVVFGHYGGRLFVVVSFKEIENFNEIAAFHSRSMAPNETELFDISLTFDDVTNKSLVK